LSEKHVVLLATPKRTTHVIPVASQDAVPSLKEEVSRKYLEAMSEVSMKQWKIFKKVPGKEVYMTMDYNRGDPLLG
jgi:hypothetical protein